MSQPKQSEIGNVPRKSASVIITRKVSDPENNSFFDYKILFLRRGGNLTFGGNYAFPGGVTDPSDYTDADLLVKEKFKTPEERQAAALRVTAVRECLEETGIYFSKNGVEDPTTKAKFTELLSKHGKARDIPFSELIMIAEPDLQNLTEFTRFITMQFLKKRYDTQFFFTQIAPNKTLNIHAARENPDALNDFDKLIINDESSEFRWLSPAEGLNLFLDKKIELVAPQFMILNILMNFKEAAAIEAFLKKIQPTKHSILNWSPLTFPTMLCLMKNNDESPSRSRYKFIGLFPEDPDYPVEKVLEVEKCEKLKAELKEKYANRKLDPLVRSRFYFTSINPASFFTDYDTEMNAKDPSPIRLLKGIDGLKSLLNRPSL